MAFSIGNSNGTFLKNFLTKAFNLQLEYPRFKKLEQKNFALALKSHLRLQMRPKLQNLEVIIPYFDRSERKQEGWGYFDWLIADRGGCSLLSYVLVEKTSPARYTRSIKERNLNIAQLFALQCKKRGVDTTHARAVCLWQVQTPIEGRVITRK